MDVFVGFCSKICCVFAVDGSCAASLQAPSDQHVSHPSEGCPVSFCMYALQLIIMYIHHAFVNALSSPIIHINLNTILYMYVEDRPTKSSYIRHYMETHTHTHTHTHTIACTHNDCSRNWVLILVVAEIL